LTLTLPQQRVITGIVLSTEPDVAASRPLSVTIETPGRTVRAVVDGKGVAAIPAVRTDRLTIRFDSSSPLRSLDLQRGITTQLPVGVSEVLLRGALDLGQGTSREAPTGLPCGFGPVLEVDGGAASQSSLLTTVGTLITGRGTTALGCSGVVRLSAGTHRIRVRSTSELTVTDVVLTPYAGQSAVPTESPSIRSWTSVDRVVSVDASQHARLLELSENANTGWVATLDGASLEATVVDGWRQAWLVPAGLSGDVRITFAPDQLYRTGLVVGAAAVVALLVLALLPGRRGDAPGRRGVPSQLRRMVTSRRGQQYVVGAVVVLVGGVWGAGVVLLTALVLPRSRHRARWVAVLAFVSGVVAGTAPWPASLDWPVVGAAASVMALAAVTVACWPWSRPTRTPVPQA
jgi:arabinofuranan 3-O-arabinosyltransferase